MADSVEQPTIVITGRIARASLPGFCERVRVLLAADTCAAIVCDVAAVTGPDAETIDVLARMQLTARRHGGLVTLRHASSRLRDLLALSGLTDVLPLCSGLAAGVSRQPEERKEPFGVEERDHPADPVP